MRKIIYIFSIILIIIILIIISRLMITSIMKIDVLEENREELMLLLDIKNSSTFSPISISTVDLGFGDTSECYTLKFEISIEDYNKNSLNYGDIDTSEISLNWKEKKDEQTYICYVREWENNEHRKELFNELKELKYKY